MASPARVLVLIKGLGIGGAERLISEATPFWDRDRFDYSVAYLLPWKNQLVAPLVDAGIAVHQLGDGRMGPATYRALRHHLDESGPDIVHAHLPSTGILARFLSRAPVVYTEHNVVSSYRQPTRALNRATYRKNRRLIAVSDAVAESVAGYPGPAPIVIPNGVSVSVEPEEAMAARIELGIPDDAVLIAHVGNIRPHKGHSNLIRAVAGLKQRGDRFHVVSIGGEKYPGDLERIRGEAEAAGVSDVFHALGRREDALAFVGAADLMANPSDHEGLPLAILEAMSLGKPVVATAVGGVPSVIRDGENGLLVPPADADALAGGIASLISDEGLRARLGKQAAEDAAAKHGLGPMIKEVESVYMGVLAESGS